MKSPAAAPPSSLSKLISRLRERSRDPVLWTELVQIVKTVAAAVVAWVLARQVFGLSQPFLAPWAALLTVQATVYRTLARGIQQVGAVVLGVVLAFLAGSAFGVNTASLAAAMLVALLAGAVKGMRSESTTAAATALVVLATGYSDDSGMLVARLADTAVGIGVGIVVTLLVWPPLRDRSAARRVDRIDDWIGELLGERVGALRDGSGRADVDAWLERTQELDEEIARAWSVVREARESGRLNLRPQATARARASAGFGTILERLEQAIAEIRSMARTVGNAGAAGQTWDPLFREPWLDLLERTGAAVAAADAKGLAKVRADLEGLSRELAQGDLPGRSWPVYGALIVNLRNIIEALGDVADAQPVEVGTPALSGRH
jgi:uncharacterized membrane protein YgaE (UPF0421/DUF939 family)